MENSSRVIKFRAWDKIKKRMLEDVSTGTVRVYGDFNELDHTSYSKDCVFMQWTGLKDKNGNEIYEGDILEGDTPYDFMKLDVVWQQCGWYPFIVKMMNNEECEIVGNIYENPNLIK